MNIKKISTILIFSFFFLILKQSLFSNLQQFRTRSSYEKIFSKYHRMSHDEKRNIVLFTATQANRGSLDDATTNEKHTSGYIMKLAHVDVMLAISQTEQEKMNMASRISIMEHRHRQFNNNRQLFILSQLALGQVIVDYDWWKPYNVEKKTKERKRYE